MFALISEVRSQAQNRIAIDYRHSANEPARGSLWFVTDRYTQRTSLLPLTYPPGSLMVVQNRFTRRAMMALLAAFLGSYTLANAEDAPTPETGKLYELRFYTTLPGKLPDLHARFRDHTMKLFEKHGMENIIYWTVSEGTKQDGDDKDNMLIYVVAHKDEAAKDASWKAFLSDPEWKAAAAKSEENGKILAKAPEAILMRDVPFSAADEPVNKDSDVPARLWELRQYNDGPERVPHTVDRFASGEDKIFSKHGMQTVKFWTATDNSAFIYLLAHKDRSAANASWKGFMSDFPKFMADYRASHPDALIGGGRGNDVRFLIPTDYSPRK
jgi:hypothetical protein